LALVKPIGETVTVSIVASKCSGFEAHRRRCIAASWAARSGKSGGRIPELSAHLL